MKTTKTPNRIKIENNNREIYDKLKAFDSFESLSNNDLFILAMVLGFYEGETKKLKGGDQLFFTHSFSDKQRSIIKSVAVFEKGTLDILLDKKEVYKIAEEYANGGITILEDMALSTKHNSSFIKRIQSLVLDEIPEIDTNESV